MNDIEKNYSLLRFIVQNYLEVPHSHEYLDLFTDLENDVVMKEGKVYLGLKHAPASRSRHHAEKGGLIKHLLEMWRIYVGLASFVYKIDAFDDAEVLRGIINHDLHKAYRTYVLLPPDQVSFENWKVEHGKDYSDCMLSSNMKTLWLLNRSYIHLTIEDFHVLGWSEGGWSEIKTSERSPLATLIYCLDELSANVLDKIRK